MVSALDPLVLIVEDDADISALMARYLADNGFATAVARDGEAMDRRMAQRRPDIVVLDINLPGEDGLSICLRLRNAGGPPVIMVTAKGEDVDRILGLEMGADDYLPKPFNPRELLARIRAVLRRQDAAGPSPAAGPPRVLLFRGLDDRPRRAAPDRPRRHARRPDERRVRPPVDVLRPSRARPVARAAPRPHPGSRQRVAGPQRRHRGEPPPPQDREEPARAGPRPDRALQRLYLLARRRDRAVTHLCRLLPGRIAAQLMVLVLLSAVIFHFCMSGAFLLNRSGWFRPLHPGLAGRVDPIVSVIEHATPEEREAVLRAVNRTDPALALRREPLDAPPEPGRRVIALSDGSALSLRADASRRGGPDPSVFAFGTLVFIALSTTLFLVWAVRGITAPLGRVAAAFDGFALDPASLKAAPRRLPETGATEIATVARGFNRMQARIARMVAERTEMLAAVSHDLRTPITRLRLRAEFVADAPLRELMLRDLGQMDTLVHGALSFIRDGAVNRVPARLDLASLLRTVCDEAADLGHRARYGGPDHLVIHGHEDELRRAVGNLVDNAARVEAEAVVELSREADGTVAVTVSDDGPGIPPERLDEVLQPFRRGVDDAARPQPSGFGLGLPIVQAIVTAHGGTFTLSNREPHGLCCRIALPAA